MLKSIKPTDVKELKISLYLTIISVKKFAGYRNFYD